MEIRLLLDHRSDLVAERTRTVNRLRWHLVTVRPELEASLKRKALNDVPGLDRVDRQLRKLHAGARTRIARHEITDLRRLEPADRRAAQRADRARRRTPPQAARRAGVRSADCSDPDRPHRRPRTVSLGCELRPADRDRARPGSSGKRTQHRLNRGGDRQLNHALHIIAITRAQHDPATQEYLARKRSEGKTTNGALRSLKRHLARHLAPTTRRAAG